MEKISSFGFRGEALSALANVCKLSLITKTENEDAGSKLEFDSQGDVASVSKCPREKGTTVMVNEMFYSLPVRQEEFHRNIKKEYGKLVPILQVIDEKKNQKTTNQIILKGICDDQCRRENFSS